MVDQLQIARSKFYFVGERTLALKQEYLLVVTDSIAQTGL
jgi:hypothetical protein